MGPELPTQKKFDSEHATPREYGEDGDVLIISKTHDESEALALIRDKLRDEYGYDEAYLPSAVSTYKVGWTEVPDDPGEYYFAVALPSTTMETHWEAWGVALQ